MSTLDRRTFLKGTLYGLLGAVLGWEIEAIAATEAALPAEEEPEVDEPWWGDDFGKLYSETGDLSAVQECECGVIYYVGPDGDDARDGLTWETRKSTCAGLLHSNNRIIIGAGRHGDYVVLD